LQPCNHWHLLVTLTYHPLCTKPVVECENKKEVGQTFYHSDNILVINIPVWCEPYTIPHTVPNHIPSCGDVLKLEWMIMASPSISLVLHLEQTPHQTRNHLFSLLPHNTLCQLHYCNHRWLLHHQNGLNQSPFWALLLLHLSHTLSSLVYTGESRCNEIMKSAAMLLLLYL